MFFFERTNYQENYPVQDPAYARPFQIYFNLREVCQTEDKENHLIYVDMIYSIVITEAGGKTVGGAKKIPVTYTVKVDENGWYIIDKYERP